MERIWTLAELSDSYSSTCCGSSRCDGGGNCISAVSALGYWLVVRVINKLPIFVRARLVHIAFVSMAFLWTEALVVYQ